MRPLTKTPPAPLNTFPPTSWVNVWFRDGQASRVLPRFLPVIRDALAQRVGEGAAAFTEPDYRDAVLDLVTVAGDTVVVLVSYIVGCSTSSPESRALTIAVDTMIESERKRQTDHRRVDDLPAETLR